MSAVVFLPASAASSLRAGQPIQVQVGSTGPHLTSTISAVGPGIIGPDKARQDFALGSAASQIITEPSVVVTIRLGTAFSVQSYAGSIVHAQVQVGTQSVLSLLQGLSNLIGE